MVSQEDIRALKMQNMKSLKKKLNVNGIGIGHKIVKGKDTGELCLTVLVKKKLPSSELLKEDLIPQWLNNIPLDVLEVGEIHAFKARTDRWRPAPGGVSIGHYAITAGTLGAIVKDRTTGAALILSNNHVLANSNNASIGDAILQPGPADGGKTPQDRIADLERFVRIQYQSGGNGNGGDCSIAQGVVVILNCVAKMVGSKTRLVTAKATAADNEVDAAVAKPVSGAIDNKIIDIGVITGTKEAEIGMAVRKSGRTTATTKGTIQVLDSNVDVGYGGSRIATYEHQIVANDMSDPGDSGSLVVDGSLPLAIGLLFAGSDTSTILSPIARVLELMNIEF